MQKKKDIRNKVIQDLSEDYKFKLENSSNDSNSDYDYEQKRKKIYLEEQDAFYKDKPNFERIINEIGEVEWVNTETQQEYNGFFSIEEDTISVVKNRKKFLWGYIFLSFIVLILVVFGVSSFLKKPGSIIVTANIEGISIFLDGKPTGLETNSVLENVNEGKHFVSVNKLGYKVTPLKREVVIESGKELNIQFELEKIDEE